MYNKIVITEIKVFCATLRDVNDLYCEVIFSFVAMYDKRAILV